MIVQESPLDCYRIVQNNLKYSLSVPAYDDEDDRERFSKITIKRWEGIFLDLILTDVSKFISGMRRIHVEKQYRRAQFLASKAREKEREQVRWDEEFVDFIKYIAKYFRLKIGHKEGLDAKWLVRQEGLTRIFIVRIIGVLSKKIQKRIDREKSIKVKETRKKISKRALERSDVIHSVAPEAEFDLVRQDLWWDDVYSDMYY